MVLNSIGILGYGTFGSFLADEILPKTLPDVTIKVYSDHIAPDGALFFSHDEVCGCDVIVLCGAIHEYEDQLLGLLPKTHPDTVIIDVASVKKHPTEIFKKYADDRKWISTHPMFGPESYKKQGGNVKGFHFVVTDYTLENTEYLTFKNMLTEHGLEVVEMSAEEHDRLLAETLFLTHYIAQSVHKAGIKRTTIDTVSFSYLMDATESVIHDTDLFRDVYRYNPYCKELVERLRDSARVVYEDLIEYGGTRAAKNGDAEGGE